MVAALLAAPVAFMLKAPSEEWSATRQKAVPPLAQLALLSAARSAA
jgi:hypothetical protein